MEGLSSEELQIDPSYFPAMLSTNPRYFLKTFYSTGGSFLEITSTGRRKSYEYSFVQKNGQLDKLPF